MDQLKNKLGSGLIMLASDNDGKVTLLAGVTKDLIGKAKAGDAVKECAPYVDGRGGGKPEMAQAGGQNPDRKSTCLNSSHVRISYAVFCLKKKKKRHTTSIIKRSDDH